MLLGDAIELLERELEIELVGDSQEVEHAIGRAAGGGYRCDCVPQGGGRDDLRRPGVGTQEIHGDASCLLGGSVLVGSVAGIPLRPKGLIPRKSAAIAIVLAVN